MARNIGSAFRGNKKETYGKRGTGSQNRTIERLVVSNFVVCVFAFIYLTVRILDMPRGAGKSEVVALTPEELAVWQEVMTPVWEQFEGNIGAELIEAALAARQ